MSYQYVDFQPDFIINDSLFLQKLEQISEATLIVIDFGRCGIIVGENEFPKVFIPAVERGFRKFVVINYQLRWKEQLIEAAKMHDDIQKKAKL